MLAQPAMQGSRKHVKIRLRGFITHRTACQRPSIAVGNPGWPADLVHRERLDFDDGAVVKMVLWRVPEPEPGCRHLYQYRLFTTVEHLIGGFLADMAKERSR